MKKLFASLLCVVMMITFMPGMAFATGNNEPVTSSSVAQIGDTEYSTLSEAVNNATVNQTIILKSDVKEDITLNKNVTLKSADNAKHTIEGKVIVKNGTLENLILKQPGTDTFLTLGSSEDKTAVQMKNVEVQYYFKDGRKTSAYTAARNKSDIVIDNCLFTNHANNGDQINNVAEWSYGLSMELQDSIGSFTFRNSEFNGAFRTMLPSINGNVTIENSRFINSAYSVQNGPTSGSQAEATCITTAESDINFNITGNTFDNAGAFYFQKTNGSVKNNTFKFDKMEHFIQTRGNAGNPLNLTDNIFETGKNAIVTVDTTSVPVILPAGQKAVTYWAWFETEAEIRPADYSSYVYAYNEDGTKIFYPGTAAALNAFVTPKTGNIGVNNGETVVVSANMELKNNTAVVVPSGKNFTIEIPKGVTLKVTEGSPLTVDGNLNITGDGKLEIAKESAITVNSAGVLDVKTPVENNGTIVNNGTLNLSQKPTGTGNNEALDSAIVHKSVIKVEAKSPTCTEDGNIEYWYCSDVGCGKYFSNPSLTKEISKANTVVHAAGHHYQNGICTACGQIMPVVPVYYNITAEKTEHGTISLEPSRVHRHGDVKVTLIPEKGYEVADLSVNGKSVGAVETYTIKDVTEDMHVAAVFKKIETEKLDVSTVLNGLKLTARSSKTSRKNIKVVVKMDDQLKAAVEELKANGYTVKYKFYRSVKKASKYTGKLTKSDAVYTNTAGKKGTMYYYKARLQVYDAAGKLVDRTELKQCRYANRLWTK